MILANFRSAILSPTFTFVVGEEETCINVHSEQIARVSKALSKSIKNDMQESREKTIRLPHIELDVFLAMYELSFNHDYSIPSDQSRTISRNLDALKRDDRPEESCDELNEQVNLQQTSPS